VKNSLIISLLSALSLSGCASYPDWLPSSGPLRAQVEDKSDTGRVEGIQLVDVNDTLARKLWESKKLGQFAELFPNKAANNYLLGPGDVIEITIWEAPPAMLFSTLAPSSGLVAGSANRVTLPAQMVAADGTITIPFVGRIVVRGHTPDEIEANIVSHLKGKANQPQVLVGVAKNNASTVTIVGEVGTSAMMPLTPKGERLLDALAFAGGVKQPVTRVSVQLSRGDVTAAMPLDIVIQDPRQNVMLKPGDVVTALFQSQTFSVLGATGKNDEIPFEAQGISLAQALARSGGLNDNRADAQGIFVFRFEDAKLVDDKDASIRAVNGTVPVVYQINLRDPAVFFVTQNFPIQNHDVIYVTNASGAEFRKFLSYVVMITSPALSINSGLSN
jgi:polysaccharide export outer membrane protein